MTFCEMHKQSGCEECPNRYVCTKNERKLKKKGGSNNAAITQKRTGQFYQ